MNMESPAKRAKQESDDDDMNSVHANVAQLTSHLTKLNGGNALDLTVIAAIEAAPKTFDNASPPIDNPHNETIQSTINQLFTAHVGKSPAIIIGNATRVVKDELDCEGDLFNKRQRNSMLHGDERQKYTNHPQNRDIKGPTPDGKVWCEMFLGSVRVEEALKGAVPLNNCGSPGKEIKEAVVHRLIRDEASKLPTIALLGNILNYVQNEASKVSTSDLLRFAVLYGLDGVMTDILHGRYGDANELTINTLIPLDDSPEEDEEDSTSRFFDLGWKMFAPAWAIGAILGYENIVTTALAQPGGTLDSSYGSMKRGDEQVQEHTGHALPSNIFLWVFMKNMPDMIKCLVNECGFQFRWIDHESHLPMIFSRIFDSSPYESFPKWTGSLDGDELMWESSRERCYMRSSAAYKEQMKMLGMCIWY